MAVITPIPKTQFIGADGVPLVGGKVYTYAAGTTTPQVTYTDSTGATANSNPIILDSRGEANIWLGEATYKFKLLDANNVEIWTVDYISAPTTALSPVLTGNVTISTDSSGPALKVTQTGTGDVLRVQDSVDPDITPFVINAAGFVGIGTVAPAEALDIDNNGKIQFSANGTARTIISADASNSTIDVAGNRNFLVKTNGGTRLTISGSGAATFASAVTFSGGVAVTGNSTVNGTLGVTGALTVSSGGAAITGNSSVTGTLGVSSTLTASNSLIVSAGGLTVSAGGLTVSAGGVAITGNSSITGTFGVSSTFTASNGLIVSAGGAAITGNSSVTGTLSASSTLTASNGLIVSAGGATITGNSSVTGTLSASSTLTASNGLIVSAGGVAITGNSSVTGTLTSSGALTVSSGGASVTGDSTIAGVPIASSAIAGDYLRVAAKTAVAASGTSIPFTGIPNWARRITIICSGVSFSTADFLQVQIGPTAALATTGYLASTSLLAATTIATVSLTSGFVVYLNDAPRAFSGTIVINLLDPTTYLYVATHSGRVGASGQDQTASGGGTVTLSGLLTQISLAGNAGGAFDAGSVSVLYE